MAAATTGRARPARPEALRPFRFPGFETRRVSNSLNLHVARYPRGPLVQLLLVLPGGAQHDPVERSGLATLTASLWDEGTEEHSALEIAGRVESLGGYLSTDADWDSLSAVVGVLSKHLRSGLELLAEVASRATFPDEELARLRSQQLADLQRRLARPEALASDALARLIYPDTAYGTPISGTSETVAAIERRDVLAQARRQLTPEGAALILVGDLSPDVAVRAAEEIFADWRGDATVSPPTIHPPSLDGVRLCVVDRPHAPQTEIRLGHVGVSRRHPDFIDLQVLNTLLGGKFTSRINMNLRERLGITYGASSSFAQRLGPGPFVVGASVSTEATGQAVGEILDELRRLQQEPVSEQELEDTKSYLLGVFPYTLQRIEGLADRLADLEIYGLPADYFDRYLDRLRSVSADDLQRLARRHLDPEHIAVVAVGPSSELEAQLSRFGTVQIETLKSLAK